jgi:hypothetical protein
VRALPDFGRPRGFNILAADAAPKISGSTSRALRARAKVSFVHAGFSRSAFWGLGLRFISFHFAFVGHGDSKTTLFKYGPDDRSGMPRIAVQGNRIVIEIDSVLDISRQENRYKTYAVDYKIKHVEYPQK